MQTAQRLVIPYPDHANFILLHVSTARKKKIYTSVGHPMHALCTPSDVHEVTQDEESNLVATEEVNTTPAFADVQPIIAMNAKKNGFIRTYHTSAPVPSIGQMGASLD